MSILYCICQYETSFTDPNSYRRSTYFVCKVEYLEVCAQYGVLVVPRAATSCGLLLYLFLHIRASASRVSTIIHTVVKLPGAHLLIIVVVLVVSFEVVVVNVLVEVGHDGEDAHVDEHEDSKHEELGSLAENS